MNTKLAYLLLVMITAVYCTKCCVPQASHTISPTALRKTDPLRSTAHY